MPGCGSLSHQHGAWWPPLWSGNATRSTPTCCASACMRSAVGICRFLPVISCHTRLTPCCMCMGYQRLSCTSQANVGPSRHPSTSPLPTCTMPKLSSAGKGDAWWKSPQRSSAARKWRCKRAERPPQSVRRSIPVSSNATTGHVVSVMVGLHARS